MGLNRASRRSLLGCLRLRVSDIETSKRYWPDAIAGYRTKIEKELEKICEDILSVLDENLIKSAESGESKVFYAKVSRCNFRLL